MARKTPPPAKVAIAARRCAACGCGLTEDHVGTCCWGCGPGPRPASTEKLILYKCLDCGEPISMARWISHDSLCVRCHAEDCAFESDQEATCRVCGCSAHDACLDPLTLEPCSWAEPGLCSTCAGGRRDEEGIAGREMLREIEAMERRDKPKKERARK